MQDFTTTTITTKTTTLSVDPAVIVSMVLMYLFVLLVVYVVTAIFLGRIFKKANTPSWIAWVPFYNTWRMLELGGQKGFWAVLAIIPVVNIASLVFMYIAMYHIGRKLGKEDMFVLLAIFLPLVWIIWLGADSSTWDESKGAKRLDTPEQPAPSTPPQTPTPQAPTA